MIRTISTLLLILAITSGCDKSSQIDQALAGELSGKWVYTDYYISPGIAVDWKPAELTGQTIEFKKNGRFITSLPYWKEIRKFEVIDSNTVRFSPGPSTDEYQMKFYIDKIKGTLELWGIGCIEGCGYRFRRSQIIR